MVCNYLQQNNRELAISSCDNLGMILTSQLSQAQDNRKLGLKSELEQCGCYEFSSLILITRQYQVFLLDALPAKTKSLFSITDTENLAI
uniref:Uncharacterized protein n=1 Tax=Romanomermis culicivorax TaxID=13658 RepID=A0A915KC14_ROMCU